MERRQQIRMEQSSLREKLEQKDIRIEDFVSEMTILNKELVEVEQEMYDEYKHMKNHIKIINTVLTDVEKRFIVRSKKYNTEKDKELWKQKYVQLINNFKYTNLDSIAKNQLIENINIQYTNISIKNHGHPFKELKTILEIQIIIENGFNINTNLYPSMVTLLSNHSKTDNIAILEYLLDNGADVTTPSTFGKPFIEDLCTRECVENAEYIKILKIILDHPLVKIDNIYLKLIIVKLNEIKCNVYKYTEKTRDEIIFVINKYIEKNKLIDEKLQDIKEVKVSNVSSSISSNIKVLEETINDYSNKILKLKGLQVTLDLLLDT